MINLETIYELSDGARQHITKLEAITDTVRAFTKAIEDLKQQQNEGMLWEIQQLRQEVSQLRQQLQKFGLPTINQYEKTLEHIRELLQGQEWPEAVASDAICNTEITIRDRAENIITLLIGDYLKDLKFLDFGCGNGQTTLTAQKKGALAIGYDPLSPESPLFTTNFEEVRNNGPYDVVLLHDVLDHLTADPIETLKLIRSILTRNGKIYVRNHPWSSRHGGHLYEHINKAFLHLILDEVELMRIGGWACEHNIKVVRPLQVYRDWFQKSGLTIETEIPIRKEVERFFLKPSHIYNRLMPIWGNEEEMAFNLSIEWVEYILKAPTPQIF